MSKGASGAPRAINLKSYDRADIENETAAWRKKQVNSPAADQER
jgi:hypothetical protein